MYCSILHRITTNNSASTTEIESNQKTNCIAFGDSSGYLEIIDINKLENKSESLSQLKEDSFVQQRRTTFQVLAFHKMPINKLMWNPIYEKIVTVDGNNSLVVWNKNENDLYNSQMVNNRGVSKIVDVRWSKSGRQISFLYEDGHIYSGTVDGKNTWFNNFEEETNFIEYSPNDDKILISKKKEKIFVLASSGKQIGEITLFESIKNFEIANIVWWGKNNEEKVEGEGLRKKHLMIAFKNGIIILVDDETDENPVVIKTELKKITKTQWEVDGLCLAVLGELVDNDEIKEEDEDDKDSKNNEKENNKKEEEKEQEENKEQEINTKIEKDEKSKKSKSVSQRSSMTDNNKSKSGMIEINNNNNIEKSGMIENNSNERSGMIENKSSEKSRLIENNNIEKSGMIENNNNLEKTGVNDSKKEKSKTIENNSINYLNNTNMNINSKNRSIILFYNVQGELLKRFVCPCQVNSFSWGHSSTIALAADKYIYIALAKFKHKWTYLNDTIVFAYLISDQKYNIIFLNTSNDTKQCKLVYNLINVISSEFYCAIIQEAKDKREYSFMITNNFCNVLDTKFVPIKPIFYDMNNQFIVISDNDYVYVLQYRGYFKPQKKGNKKDKSDKNVDLTNIKNTKYNIPMGKLDPKNMNEFVFFVESELNPDIEYNYKSFVKNKKTKSPIINLSLSGIYLFIAKSNGIINKYNLYTMFLERKFKIDETIKTFGLSPSNKYLWCINTNDYLSIYNIENEKPEKLNYYQKEVWDIKWSEKNEEDEREDSLDFVILQKNRLYFINNLQVEGEMIKCTDYLGKYSNNEITTVKIEKLNNDRNNDFFDGKSYLKKYQNKVLKEFNELLENSQNTDLKPALEYASKNPCNNFYSKITKKALEKLDFDSAQTAMLQTGDFEGLQFLKKVKNIEDDELKKAEILEFNNNYDEASNKYNKMGRSDLNLAMNIKLGKWDKVTDMMSKNDEKDENLKIAYNNYADELYEKKDYDKAEDYYKKSGNVHGLINTYFAKEEYTKAAEMIDVIPKEDEFLEEMGDKFRGMGMCKEAVMAYTKRGNLKKAMETYIENNKWSEAVELSRENDFYNMEQLTNKFGAEFIKNGRKLDLVELFNKANMKLKVNKYLIEIACDMWKLRAKPLIIKKIYVLAALELENYKNRISDSQIDNDEHQDNIDEIKSKEKEDEKNNDENPNKKKTNNNYSTKEIDKILFNSWRGAEAFHYYMLCQFQLYNRKFKEACKTSIRLTLYEKELGSEEVYRLIALCSYLNKSFAICSNALCTLEKLNAVNKFRQDKYEKLAKSIFVQYEPKNVDEKFFKCPNNECKQAVSEYDIYCKNCGMNFSGCVLTGASILDHHYFKCKQCHHRTKKSEVKKSTIGNCPLCHCTLNRK